MLWYSFRSDGDLRLLALHRFWVKVFFKLSGIGLKVNNYFYQDLNRPYILVCNHFSSFDNFAIYQILNTPFKVVGLDEIGKLPLYGRIFSKMHLLIKRNCTVSKQKAMLSAMKSLNKGYSLMLAPEGGIKSLNPPLMAAFEDGAFVLAIRKQLPIVPFVFESNHRILPEFPLRYMHRKVCEITILPAINTEGLGLEDLEELKDRVFNAMQDVLGRNVNTASDLSKRSRWNLIRDFR